MDQDHVHQVKMIKAVVRKDSSSKRTFTTRKPSEEGMETLKKPRGRKSKLQLETKMPRS